MEQTRWIPKDSTLVTREGINGIVYTSTFTGIDGVLRYSAIGYRGKSSKISFNYSFRNEAQMNTHIDEFFSGIKSYQDYQEGKRAERKAFKTTIKPGDILHTSWGYDQTNVEFFQVLTVSNNTITLREIYHNHKETGYMQGQTSPVKDKFVEAEPILTKRVGLGEYVRIDDVRSAWIHDGKPCYTSSYA
jgi:hypothetical protein